MAEYYSYSNHRGKTGISSRAIASLARLSADSISDIKTGEKEVAVRIYGDLIKIIIGIQIAEGQDIIKKCQEVKEEVTRAITDQLDIRSLDVRVTSLGTC